MGLKRTEMRAMTAMTTLKTTRWLRQTEQLGVRMKATALIRV
jgi:hypothetical protein